MHSNSSVHYLSGNLVTHSDVTMKLQVVVWNSASSIAYDVPVILQILKVDVMHSWAKRILPEY